MNCKRIIKKTSLIALALIFVFACAENASAQADEVLIVKQKARTAIRPKAKPATKKVDFVRKVSIARVEKKNRRNYRKPAAPLSKNVKTIAKTPARRIEEPLLAVQLKLMMVNRDGSESEVNPLATFTPNDRLRLSIKANQRGYLYVIRQKSPEAEGEIIFPSSVVNNGKNLISANYEYVIPKNCPKEIIANARDCALTLFPYDESPQEYFTLIFTRDQLVDLPDDVKNTRVSLANLMTGGKLPVKTLIDLIEDSNQDLVAQTGDTPFGIRIVNQNQNDNEEIIETFILNKLKK
ncbi:MAG TPA: hypothetical protein VK308_15525 [Pyrinomonadaceae bacterium]|nr:hypothetical protein [Pyrinomonadaceae bacterium]